MATTATPPRLKDMTAVAKDGRVKPLGYIVWFSVPDIDVSARRVKRLWGLAGLDLKALGKIADVKEIDAFRRAVRAEEGRVTREGGDVVETDVRDIPSNDTNVWYQVSRVVKDSEQRLVEYPKALQVWYSKITGQVDYRALGDVKRKDVLPIMEGIQERFEANVNTVTGAKVRGLVRSYLTNTDDEQSDMTGLSAENMRGKAGGVYFVLARYGDQLESLAEFLGELYPDGRGYLYTVPLADSASEREMIRRQHAANCLAEIEEATGEVRELLRQDRKRGVRENVISHHFRVLDRLRRRAGEYASALQEEQASLTDHLDVLNGQLRKLLGA